MNPIVYAIPVFMVTVLIEAVIAYRQKRPLYNIPDALTSLHAGVLSRISEAFLKTLTAALYILVWQNYRAADLPASNPLVWVGALLAYDLMYYWAHRFGHEMNLLWAGHVVHHSSEYFNLSTALRQSSTSSLWNWVFFVPLAIVGVPPQVFAVVALIDLLYQYWVHTELIGRMGWLDRVFVTPSNHRVHHGQNDYCIDKNYGGILIIWDRIFGTFADERDNEKVVYGVRKALKSYNPLWTNLHYYAELWRESRAAKGWRAKLGMWLAPPSGWTGERLAQFEPTAFQRFDRQTPPVVQWYSAAQYAVTVALITHFIAVAPKLDLGLRALYALGILGTAMSLGALLEGRTWGRRIEQARIAALGIAFAAAPAWFGFDAPTPLKAAALIFALASTTWLTWHAAPQAPERRRMTADALSDLILAGISVWIVWREWPARPALALGIGAVGVAACLGIARFSEVTPALGPHQFASMLSATAGLPLLAAGLCWPDGDTARRPRAAVRFLLVASALSMALVLGVGFALWKQIAPGLAGAAILVAAVAARSPVAIAGALMLAASFAITATGAAIGPFNSTQGLHYAMAAAFVLLVQQPARKLKASTSEP